MHDICLSLSPGDVVFDIGANRGDKTAEFLSRGASVVAVEPQPRMVQILRERFEANENVTILPIGIAAKAGRLTMEVNNEVPAISTFQPRWKEGRFKELQWDERVEVEVWPLDDLLVKFGRPRFLKIDVEGFEEEALAGLSSRVDCLSFEFTNEFFSHALRALERLRALGFERYNYSLGDNTFFQMANWSAPEDVIRELDAYRAGYALAFGDIYAA